MTNRRTQVKIKLELVIDCIGKALELCSILQNEDCARKEHQSTRAQNSSYV